jgi:hypothetical protein
MSDSPSPIITLTTDFGHDTPYVAAMKGVILNINPAGHLIDLCHDIPPQDLRHAAFCIAGSIPYFPPGAIHVIVVDPGVGSDRALLYVEIAGHRLLVPDNGCWTTLLPDDATPARVIRLSEPRWWRAAVSHTFHGRDILAPVAGHLSLGIDPAQFGPPAGDYVRLPISRPRTIENGIQGEVVFVDHFGNLVTNIPGGLVSSPPTVLQVGKKTFTKKWRWVHTYAEAPPGNLVALVSSAGTVELAVVQGNGAQTLKAGVGTAVTIGWAGR